MQDENAFGLLFAFYDIEDVEYGLEPEEFVERFTEFRSTVLSSAAEVVLGEAARVIDLGHALYFEVGDGDHGTDPIAWLRRVREALVARDFSVSAIVSHGGRWLADDDADWPERDTLEGGYRLVHLSRPSEPLRRALAAEAATHGTDGTDGWGAGTYV
ncbi:MAG TPA: hypothetical protein VFQ35_06415, partial [Polyangiaceae bacterium]|nr:hypothetical protein [Polyangiaceae bacterium]